MVNVDAKKIDTKTWEVYKNYGRDKTNIEILRWIKLIQKMGCGEILLTSVDHEGLEKGYDLELLNKVNQIINVPLIISGGCGSKKDIQYIKENFPNVSVSLASILHYNKFKIKNSIVKKICILDYS